MHLSKEGFSVEGKELPPITDPKFVLLLGPSGVGKTTILTELVSRDSRFCLNPVYTNRVPREGDVGRISLVDEEIERMKSNGDLLTDSSKFGNRYVIKSSDVQTALELGRIPMQDYPIGKMDDIISSGIPNISIYIAPPSLSSWRQRLAETGRDILCDRYEEGISEFRFMAMNGYEHPMVDYTVINDDLTRAVNRVQSLIYR